MTKRNSFQQHVRTLERFFLQGEPSTLSMYINMNLLIEDTQIQNDPILIQTVSHLTVISVPK